MTNNVPVTFCSIFIKAYFSDLNDNYTNNNPNNNLNEKNDNNGNGNDLISNLNYVQESQE